MKQENRTRGKKNGEQWECPHQKEAHEIAKRVVTSHIPSHQSNPPRVHCAVSLRPQRSPNHHHLLSFTHRPIISVLLLHVTPFSLLHTSPTPSSSPTHRLPLRIESNGFFNSAKLCRYIIRSPVKMKGQLYFIILNLLYCYALHLHLDFSKFG